ncbi:glycosyltransferase family 32 protein [Bacteroides hominis]|uniref:Glycosyl transferase n=1 Tax=Bacteroides fragilis TaxID=817 RepID=A0A0I9S7X7_BACFG|nr:MULTISPECIES: glycosyltransferase [Bacteroides]MCE8565245.1 glycosyl transferase [Bacteroides fragilis]MCM0225950.1 glycosyl transferase [Bacteroides fragilis]MCM0238562.1 glycosyl transferase [Bacteroides fragilis]MCM0263331.1 glycosyl transferase [Bacteroides fragilis]MDV6173200.1 glycosyltransferase [Bacteroides hominis (ex Liu et al. 2022)]
MIPKKIHYCWFGKGKMPELALKCIESWRVNLPDYELKEWNENSFDINSNFYVKEAYESRKFAFVTDYVRLYALYTEGGIYMDTDVEVLKNLDPFLDLPAFSGFEDNVHIPTGIMAAEKGSVWAGWQLKYYDDRHFLLPDGTLDLTTNVEIIGRLMEEKGFILRNGLYNFQNIITIFPRDYFCPKSHTTGKIELTQNTYTIHHFAGSWKSTSDRLKRRIVHLIGVKMAHRLKLFINLFR